MSDSVRCFRRNGRGAQARPRRRLLRGGGQVRRGGLRGDGEEKDSATYAEAWSSRPDDSTAKAVKLLRGMPDNGTWQALGHCFWRGWISIRERRGEAKTVISAAMTAKLFVGDDVELAKSLCSPRPRQNSLDICRDFLDCGRKYLWTRL